MRVTTRLRRLLTGTGPVVCVGAHDPVSARLVEQAGFPALHLGGYVAAATVLGAPDVGLLTYTEMVNHIARCIAASNLPAIADADTGYGNPINVQRTIRGFIRAGVAGCHIEDQVMPKKCGHIPGKQVIPAKEMVQKIRAACDARTDEDFVLIARTDALTVNGLADAIERCQLYAEAGADALFVDAPRTMEELETIARELASTGKPLVFNAARTGKSPTISVEEASRLGFKLVIFPIELLMLSVRAMQRGLEQLRVAGSTDSLVPDMVTFEEFNRFIGMNDYLAKEAQYAS